MESLETKKNKIMNMLAELQANMPVLMENVPEAEIDKTLARLRQVFNIGVEDDSPFANR